MRLSINLLPVHAKKSHGKAAKLAGTIATLALRLGVPVDKFDLNAVNSEDRKAPAMWVFTLIAKPDVTPADWQAKTEELLKHAKL